MTDRNENRRDEAAGDASHPARDVILPAEHGFWWKLWLVLKTLQARLRFVFILVAIGGLIAYWDTLSAYYDRWTRPPGDTATASADTEYFCPMHPYIVRDNPK